MSTLNIMLFIFQRLGVFSLILLFVFMSCETKTEMESLENSKGPIYPLIPAELVGQEIDTIVTFDPDTYEETVSYEIHDPERYIQVDTIYIFDPETYKESMRIIKHNQGQNDTILVY